MAGAVAGSNTIDCPGRISRLGAAAIHQTVINSTIPSTIHFFFMTVMLPGRMTCPPRDYVLCLRNH